MLTKSEEEIMYLLWDLDEPLTSSEIVKKAVNKTWKKSYINLLINSLLKKDMIKVVGVKQMTKNYARTFVPTMQSSRFLTDRILPTAIFRLSSQSLLREPKAQMFLMSLKLSLKSAVKNSANNLCK